MLKKKSSALTEKETRAKYGTLYSGVEAYKKPNALAFTTLFCARRFFFAATIVFLGVFLIGQVFVNIMSSLAMTCWFVAVRPMEDTPTNLLYAFNEFMLLIYSYYVLLFSEYVTEPEDRYLFGWVYLGLLIFILAMNLVLVGYIVFVAIRRFRELAELKK